MRDRLIEILEDDYDFSDFTGQVNYEALADHLLKNGVIVPPCKVGDTVYIMYEDCNYIGDCRGMKCEDCIYAIPRFCPAEVDSIQYAIYIMDLIGKRVFLTKEEAEAKLAELKGE